MAILKKIKHFSVLSSAMLALFPAVASSQSGIIRQTAVDWCLPFELPADGRALLTEQFPDLSNAVGCSHGGDCGFSFELPDLRSRTPIGAGQGESLSEVRVGARHGSDFTRLGLANLPDHTHGLWTSDGVDSHSTQGGGYLSHAAVSENLTDRQATGAVHHPSLHSATVSTVGASGLVPLFQPFLATNFCVGSPLPADYFLGQIVAFTESCPPDVVHSDGYLVTKLVEADGRMLSIADNSALFSLFGTLYGGDGRNTFAIPDLRGRMVVGVGPSADGRPIEIGQRLGAESVVLAADNLPPHRHDLLVSAWPADTDSPVNGSLVSSTSAGSVTTDHGQLSLHAETAPVSSFSPEPIDVRHPSVAVKYCVVTAGLFPARE